MLFVKWKLNREVENLRWCWDLRSRAEEVFSREVVAATAISGVLLCFAIYQWIGGKLPAPPS